MPASALHYPEAGEMGRDSMNSLPPAVSKTLVPKMTSLSCLCKTLTTGSSRGPDMGRKISRLVTSRLAMDVFGFRSDHGQRFHNRHKVRIADHSELDRST